MEETAKKLYKDPFYNYLQSRVTRLCPFIKKQDHLNNCNMCSYPHDKKVVKKKSEFYCIFGCYCPYNIYPLKCKMNHLSTQKETDDYITFIDNFIKINKNILIEKAKFELNQRLKFFNSNYTFKNCETDYAIRIISESD